MSPAPTVTSLSALAWGRRDWLLGTLGLLAGAGHAAEPQPFRLGLYLPTLRDMPRKDVEVSMRFWYEELARAANVTFLPARYYDDMGSLKRDVDAGVVNFFIATVMAMAENFSSEDLRDGIASYKSVDDDLLLVVGREAGIRSIKDLPGKRLALMDSDELTEVYLETLLLTALGRTGPERLGPITRETRSSKLTHRLFFKQADAALIYRSGYEATLALNPQIAQRLQVLDAYTFKTRAPSIGLFSAQVDSVQREQMIRTMLEVGRTPRGRQVLELYQADTMVRASVSEIAPYQALLERRRALRQVHGLAKGRP